MTPEEEKTLRDKAALFDQLVEAEKIEKQLKLQIKQLRGCAVLIEDRNPQGGSILEISQNYRMHAYLLESKVLPYITLAANLTEQFVRRGE